MNFNYSEAAVAKAFAAVCNDAVTEQEFLNARTPEEMSDLLDRAGIDRTIAFQTVLGLSTMQDEETRVVFPAAQLH